MANIVKWLTGALALCCLSTSSYAGVAPLDPPLVQIAGGVFDIVHQNKRNALAQVEYKWSPLVYKLRPFVGLMGTDRESAYIYAGLGFDVFIGNNFVITPSFAPGLYFQGHGKNLGYPLEFRSSVEAAIVFGGQHRLGLQFYHLSNASLSHKNPGVECLVLFLAIPLKY